MDPFIDPEQWILANEAWIRLLIFASIFVIMMVCELSFPRRVLSLSRKQRWGSNISLFVINSLLLRVIFPTAAVGLALSVSAQGWGLFNLIEWPFWIEFTVALLLLDFAIYGQHWLMHQLPVLWRLHRVHHADLDFDLTTGFRFHTLEILFSMLFKWLVILLLGPAVLAVLIFEVILNSMAVFNHSNISLPSRVEPLIRKLLVTPDMHRVHHSIIRTETDSNYGFNLSVWDRLLGTYRDQPQKGHDAMTIGIPQFRDPQQVDRLPGMLMLPFVGKS